MATGTKIGDAYILVNADTDKAERNLKGLDDTANTSAGSLGKLDKAFLGTAVVAAAGVAAKAIFDFGKASVDAASNLAESQNAIQVTFGESADAIAALGDTSAEKFGLSERAFNDFAVRFSAFADKIAGASGQKVEDVVEGMTTRIADFASVMNLDMADAAVVFQSALAGETESFRRFGGDVSAAAVQMKALELGLGDASGELTEQEKILARYELIMEQTEKTAGDFANTSESLANQQRTLTANLEDFQAKVGSLLVPVIADGTGALNDMLTIMDALASKATDLAGTGGEGGGGSGVLGVVGAIAKFIPGIGPVVSGGDAIVSTWNLATGSLDAGARAIEGAGEAAGPAMISVGALERQSQTMDKQLVEHNIPSLGALERKHQDVQAAADFFTSSQYLATEALKVFEDEVRSQIDPIFALEEANQAVADAQANVVLALDEFGQGSPEHIEAIGEVARANLDLEGAQLNVVAAGSLTREEFVKQQVELGLSKADADLYADALERINAFKPKPINFRLTVNGTTYGSVAAAERAIQGVGRQHGGIVWPGGGGLVGESGPELFIPAVAGRIIPNTSTERIIAALEQDGTTGSGGISAVFNISVGAGATRGDAMMVGNEVENALRRVAAGRTVR